MIRPPRLLCQQRRQLLKFFDVSQTFNRVLAGTLDIEHNLALLLQQPLQGAGLLRCLRRQLVL